MLSLLEDLYSMNPRTPSTETAAAPDMTSEKQADAPGRSKYKAPPDPRPR